MLDYHSDGPLLGSYVTLIEMKRKKETKEKEIRKKETDNNECANKIKKQTRTY